MKYKALLRFAKTCFYFGRILMMKSVQSKPESRFAELALLSETPTKSFLVHFLGQYSPVYFLNYKVSFVKKYASL